jgi:hypothetical protein
MPSMADLSGEGARPLSALPSPGARLLAFIAILIGGTCGGLIGFGFMRLEVGPGHDIATALGALVGAVLAAIGMSVVAVLVLRAMGEWRHIQDSDSA